MEFEFIRWVREEFGDRAALIGNDAAALAWTTGEDCVVTTDLLADGVHFRSSEVDPERVGRKALAVNLSDMASMAARPLAAFISLLLPRDTAAETARRCLRGMEPLAKQFDVQFAGGDTNVWDGPWVINVALVGTANHGRTWPRCGMQVGDWLLATGAFGGSRHGHHLDFVPRVREALQIAQVHDIHAAIDVSDGLALDASRLADASQCGIVLNSAAIPLAAAAFLPDDDQPQRTPLQHALYDGEDFELLLSMSHDEGRALLAHPPDNLPLRVIGEAIAEPGLWLTDEHGQRNRLEPRGYEHGAT